MFSSYPKVYLEIDENRLFIGKLKRKRGHFICEVFDEWPLTSFEVKDGVIYKPSSLYLLIKSFLKDKRLMGSKAIVCCPYLAFWRGVDRRLPFFQVSLYVSKVGLKVYSLFGEGILTENKDMDNKLSFHKDVLKSKFDFFCHFRLRQKKAVLSWLATSTMLLVIAIIGVSVTHAFTAKRSSVFHKKKLGLSSQLMGLHSKVKTFSVIKHDNKKLQKELLRVEASIVKRKAIFSFFKTCAAIIPPRTWLDSLVIKDSKKGGKGGQGRSY